MLPLAHIFFILRATTGELRGAGLRKIHDQLRTGESSAAIAEVDHVPICTGPEAFLDSIAVELDRRRPGFEAGRLRA